MRLPPLSAPPGQPCLCLLAPAQLESHIRRGRVGLHCPPVPAPLTLRPLCLQDLKLIGVSQPKYAAELAENRGKNRYNNVLPCECFGPRRGCLLCAGSGVMAQDSGLCALALGSLLGAIRGARINPGAAARRWDLLFLHCPVPASCSVPGRPCSEVIQAGSPPRFAESPEQLTGRWSGAGFADEKSDAQGRKVTCLTVRAGAGVGQSCQGTV